MFSVLALVLAFALGTAATLGFVLLRVTSTKTWPRGVDRPHGKDPPLFAGAPLDFKEWLFSVEEALRSRQPHDPVAYAASFMEGNARRWFMGLAERGERPKDWSRLKDLLTRAFAAPHEAERNRRLLVQCRQSADLESYITTFSGLCLLAAEVDELTKATLFVAGLTNEQVRREVRREHPMSLQEAIRSARACADDVSLNLPQLESSHAQVRGLRRAPERPWSEEELRRLRREGRCFKCKRVGHRAANCRDGPHPNDNRQ